MLDPDMKFYWRTYAIAAIITIGGFAIASALSGCTSTAAFRAQQEVTKVTKSICDNLPDITYSKSLDTAETKAQIRRNNAKRDAFCNPTQETKK